MTAVAKLKGYENVFPEKEHDYYLPRDFSGLILFLSEETAKCKMRRQFFVTKKGFRYENWLLPTHTSTSKEVFLMLYTRKAFRIAKACTESGSGFVFLPERLDGKGFVCYEIYPETEQTWNDFVKRFKTQPKEVQSKFRANSFGGVSYLNTDDKGNFRRESKETT